MDYTIILRPLIGAGIGYITNWIAVKMMFRPLNPIKLGNFTLPFTPGIIPKNKERLAESIGDSISKNLLTEETLKNTLLSNDIKLKIKENIEKYLNSLDEDSLTIKDSICKYISEDNYTEIIEKLENKISSSIFDTICEANLGKIISEQITIAAKEKLKGSILGIFGGKSIISTISENAELKINDYIKKDGKQIINNMVNKELEKYSSSNISNIASSVSDSNIDLISIFMNIYENFVIKKLSTILGIIDVSKIVKEKINSMDTLELEKLLLLIMKKELNALVNLGAIIGFLLGMINLLF